MIFKLGNSYDCNVELFYSFYTRSIFGRGCQKYMFRFTLLHICHKPHTSLIGSYERIALRNLENQLRVFL